jgi:hypothetical protein
MLDIAELSLLEQAVVRVIQSDILREVPVLYEPRLEINTGCNARCLFCNTYTPETKLRTLSVDEVVERTRQCYDISPFSRYVTWCPMHGDPLLHEGLPDVLDAVAERVSPHLWAQLFTNGIGIDRYTDQQISTILKHIDTFNISMPMRQESFEKLFQVRGFDKLKRSIERLLDIHQRDLRSTQIVFAGREQSYGKYAGYQDVDPDIRRLWKRAASQTGSPVFAPETTYSGSFGVERNPAQVFHQPMDLRRPLLPCMNSALLNCTILLDGTVTFCSCMYLAGKGAELGNIHDQPLPEILCGAKRLEYLRGFLKGEPPSFCETCWQYLYGTDEWISTYYQMRFAVAVGKRIFEAMGDFRVERKAISYFLEVLRSTLDVNGYADYRSYLDNFGALLANNDDESLAPTAIDEYGMVSKISRRDSRALLLLRRGMAEEAFHLLRVPSEPVLEGHVINLQNAAARLLPFGSQRRQLARRLYQRLFGRLPSR